MSNETDMQGCEHCDKELPIERMRMMGECWFCEGCTEEWQQLFDKCQHEWRSGEFDEHGEPGQYCAKCSGFVCDEDFPLLFGEVIAL